MTDNIIDILESLEPHFDYSFSESDKANIDQLYAYYYRDFFDLPFTVNGINIKVKSELYSKNITDGLPAYFTKYHEKFVHLITREKAGRTISSPKLRKFKEDRANRIHWIKPILQNYSDPRIIHFSFQESDGKIRNYYWLKTKKYMVVLEMISPDFTLITGYCVDDNNIGYYETKYLNRITP